MTKNDQAIFKRIRTHLFNLHTAWEKDPENDWHHKSNEGYISLSFAYPNWFEAKDYLKDEPEVYSVEIYSYLFGPSHLHHYRSLEEAWDEVKKWSYHE